MNTFPVFSSMPSLNLVKSCCLWFSWEWNIFYSTDVNTIPCASTPCFTQSTFCHAIFLPLVYILNMAKNNYVIKFVTMRFVATHCDVLALGNPSTGWKENEHKSQPANQPASNIEHQMEWNRTEHMKYVTDYFHKIEKHTLSRCVLFGVQKCKSTRTEIRSA